MVTIGSRAIAAIGLAGGEYHGARWWWRLPVGRRRRVLEPRAVWVFAGHAFVFGVRRVDERTRTHRQRRHFVGVEGPHQARRDQHHQLGLLGAHRAALEQVADDRQAAQDRNRLPVGLREVVEQAGNREGLSVAQLHVGFRTPGVERRNPEAREHDAVGEIQRAHFRPELQADDVAGDRGREAETNAELLEENRQLAQPGHHGIGFSPPARKLASWPL